MVIKLIYYQDVLLYLIILPDSDSKESTIVSRYISSMKKKPSLQGVINRAKKHPYQRSASDALLTQDVSAITQSSLCNKVIESV